MLDHFTLSALPFPEPTFWRHVRIDESGCWLWMACTRWGYGTLNRSGVLHYAHRYVYMRLHGEIAKGMEVCHRCDVRPCVNPAHLFLGTRQDNVRDCVEKGRHKGMAGGDQSLIRLHPDLFPVGEAKWNSRLSEYDVRAIRNTYAAGGTSHRKLGVQYGVSAVTIGLIVRRELWTHIE